jgi:hypothetical protein
VDQRFSRRTVMACLSQRDNLAPTTLRC